MSEIDYGGDEDVVMRARRYAYKQLDALVQGEKYQRNAISNATKIAGYLMRTDHGGQGNEHTS